MDGRPRERGGKEPNRPSPRCTGGSRHKGPDTSEDTRSPGPRPEDPGQPCILHLNSVRPLTLGQAPTIAGG